MGRCGCKDEPGPSLGHPPPEHNGRFASSRNCRFLFSVQEFTVADQLKLRIVCALLTYLVQALCDSRHKEHTLRLRYLLKICQKNKVNVLSCHSRVCYMT